MDSQITLRITFPPYSLTAEDFARSVERSLTRAGFKNVRAEVVSACIAVPTTPRPLGEIITDDDLRNPGT